MSRTQTVGSALAAAREVLPAFDAIERCLKCGQIVAQIKMAMKDARAISHKRAQGVSTSRTWDELVEKATSDLMADVEFALAHLDIPHAEAAASEPPAERSRKPVDTRPTCPACGSHVNVTGNRIAAHKAGSGNACKRRLMEPPKVAAPPVRIPPPARVPSLSHTAERAEPHRSRLEAGSECRECGKWLPGERQLCGACSVQVSR